MKAVPTWSTSSRTARWTWSSIRLPQPAKALRTTPISVRPPSRHTRRISPPWQQHWHLPRASRPWKRAKRAASLPCKRFTQRSLNAQANIPNLRSAIQNGWRFFASFSVRALPSSPWHSTNRLHLEKFVIRLEKISCCSIIYQASEMRRTFLGSSMAEHSAVNRRVVGSSPTRGAIETSRPGSNFLACFFITILCLSSICYIYGTSHVFHEIKLHQD